MAKKPIVLIVDDVKSNVVILSRQLNNDYQIKTAADGHACLDQVYASPMPDLILLDIEMPGMNGYEVCEQLKKDSLTRDIPVIFVTANDQAEEEERGLQVGAVDYITKPFRPSIVSARIKTHITLKQQRDKLTAMATHDQLTGLYNRNYLLQSARKKIARSIRHEISLSLIMLDIDHFKKVNDQYGHPTGDAVLQAVANELLYHTREEDVIARFGGEEFLVLLDFCSLEEAKVTAERLRIAIEELQPEQITVTSSFGVTQLHSGKESIDSLISRADKALYKAKESGRNKVIATRL